jgi:hypothetical protein
MSGLSTPMEVAVLQAICKGQPLPAFPDLYVALHTADPGDTGANELTLATAPGYGRVQLVPDPTPSDGNWTLDAGGPVGQSRMRNNRSVLFGTAAAAWPPVAFYGLWRTLAGTAPTDFVGGAPLTGPGGAPLAPPGLTIDAGNRIEFEALGLEFWLQ